jgi:GxxExxY protein
MLYEDLSQQVIGCAMLVHRLLGPGFLESVYQNALAHELKLAGLEVRAEARIRVIYRDIVVGEFVADLLINDVLLIENKAVRKLAPAHEVQLVNYLTATRRDVGLLLNFGGPSLEFKRKIRLYRSRSSADEQSC